jgi:hypothetical protein
MPLDAPVTNTDFIAAAYHGTAPARITLSPEFAACRRRATLPSLAGMRLPLRPLVLVTALIALAGCAATEVQQRENLLTASGFRTKPATTPQQAAMLGTLPTDKISPISHHGHVLFVYPDPGKNLLYVGSPAEYAAYKKVRTEKKFAIEEQQSAFQQQDKWADLDGWKGLSDGWYNF